MALWYAMAMAHRLSSCGGNDMDEKKSAPAEIETVTITMNRPVAEAVAKACEMYLRLHLGQFEDLIDELCMAKFYAALENDSFDGKEERNEDQEDEKAPDGYGAVPEPGNPDDSGAAHRRIEGREQRSLLSRLPKELQSDRVQLRRRGAALSQQLRFEVTTG